MLKIYMISANYHNINQSCIASRDYCKNCMILKKIMVNTQNWLMSIPTGYITFMSTKWTTWLCVIVLHVAIHTSKKNLMPKYLATHTHTQHTHTQPTCKSKIASQVSLWMCKHIIKY